MKRGKRVTQYTTPLSIRLKMHPFAVALLLCVASAQQVHRITFYSDGSCSTPTIRDYFDAWTDVCSQYSGRGLALTACVAGVNATAILYSTTDGSCASTPYLTITANTTCTATPFGWFAKLTSSEPCTIAPATLYLAGKFNYQNCSDEQVLYPTLVGACAQTGFSGVLGLLSNTTFDPSSATLTSAAFSNAGCQTPAPPSYSFAGLPINGTCRSGWKARAAAPYTPPPAPPPLTPAQHTMAVFSDAACTTPTDFLDAWTDRCSVYNGFPVALTACSATSVTATLFTGFSRNCSGAPYDNITATTTCAPVSGFSDMWVKLASLPTACALGAEPLFIVSQPFSKPDCSDSDVQFIPVRAGVCLDTQYFGYPSTTAYNAAADTLNMTTFLPGGCISELSLASFANVPVSGVCTRGFEVFLAPTVAPAPAPAAGAGAKGLSPGAIAGVSIGAVAAVAFFAATAFNMCGKLRAGNVGEKQSLLKKSTGP